MAPWGLACQNVCETDLLNIQSGRRPKVLNIQKGRKLNVHSKAKAVNKLNVLKRGKIVVSRHLFSLESDDD